MLVFAMAWVGRSRRNHAVALYVALVFRRDVVSIRPKLLLVVDFNALHDGVVYAVVEEARVPEKGVLRPDVSKLVYLQRKIARLDALCAHALQACRGARATKSRLWRLLRQWEDETARRIVKLAIQCKAAIIADAPNDELMRRLKEGDCAAERKAFLNFGRLRRRIGGLAEWRGVPYREERLYSAVCPKYGAESSDRYVSRCGFSAHRDEVSAPWAMRRFRELLK